MSKSYLHKSNIWLQFHLFRQDLYLRSLEDIFKTQVQSLVEIRALFPSCSSTNDTPHINRFIPHVWILVIMDFSCFQSHWDWLPTEIQDYIFLFVLSQSVRHQRKPLKENLLREICNYHALKVAWNHPPITHGRIHITHRKCIKRCPNNISMDLPDYSRYCYGKSCTINHSYIWGIYTLENRQYEIFMGHNFPEAFRRVNASLSLVKRHNAVMMLKYNGNVTGTSKSKPIMTFNNFSRPSR